MNVASCSNHSFIQTNYRDDQLSEFVIEHYCVCDNHGKFIAAKIDKVRAALEKTIMDLETVDNHLPAVDGLPVRKALLGISSSISI